MKQRLFPALLVAICMPYLGATARAQPSANDPALQRLEREITRLAGLSDGVVGVAVTHLETRRKVSLRHGEKFPRSRHGPWGGLFGFLVGIAEIYY